MLAKPGYGQDIRSVPLKASATFQDQLSIAIPVISRPPSEPASPIKKLQPSFPAPPKPTRVVDTFSLYGKSISLRPLRIPVV